jgi:hypothetical protein
MVQRRIPQLLQTLLQQLQRYHLPIRLNSSGDCLIRVSHNHHHLVLCYASTYEACDDGVPMTSFNNLEVQLFNPFLQQLQRQRIPMQVHTSVNRVRRMSH